MIDLEPTRTIGGAASSVSKGLVLWCGMVAAVACGRSLSDWVEARWLRHQLEAECRRLHQTNVALAAERRQQQLLHARDEDALAPWRRLLKEIS